MKTNLSTFPKFDPDASFMEHWARAVKWQRDFEKELRELLKEDGFFNLAYFRKEILGETNG